MIGLWVGLASPVTFHDVRAVLDAWFPACRVGEFSQLLAAPPGTEWPEIVLQLHDNPSEFPVHIDITLFPGPQDEAVVMSVMIELARRFSATFHCRTICDGSGHGDSPAPYWSIIWDAGVPYLADDAGTLFADGEGHEVRTIRPLDLPPVTLDPAGQLVR